METINTLTRELTIGGKAITVDVTIAWEYDDMPIDVDFGDAEAEREYIERFNNGELANVCIRVKATYLKSEGTDYLGGCHILSDKWDEEIESIVGEHGMIDTALDYLTKELVEDTLAYAELA